MVVLFVHDFGILIVVKVGVSVSMLVFFVNLDILAGFLSLPDSLLALRLVFERSCKNGVALLLHHSYIKELSTKINGAYR